MTDYSGLDNLLPLALPQLFLRLVMALFVGAGVGLEREIHQKAAGLKTHMIVSLGAALFVLVPVQLGLLENQPDALSRILQGVITGIGFVGGGAILHDLQRPRGAKIRGLTTAATIWLSCGLGIAIACGLWDLAILTAFLAIFTLGVVKFFEERFFR
ncbi:MgtC/SapB family protein [Pannus brasiliensis CCIBt3594]|uniref:MgtC/SapB family protein n=1 Tax=Pannus brasiliensis CCIBt3594 TaxID=1427578 RepID=A0AAW9QM00_9CHRO